MPTTVFSCFLQSSSEISTNYILNTITYHNESFYYHILFLSSTIIQETTIMNRLRFQAGTKPPSNRINPYHYCRSDELDSYPWLIPTMHNHPANDPSVWAYAEVMFDTFRPVENCVEVHSLKALLALRLTQSRFVWGSTLLENNGELMCVSLVMRTDRSDRGRNRWLFGKWLIEHEVRLDWAGESTKQWCANDGMPYPRAEVDQDTANCRVTRLWLSTDEVKGGTVDGSPRGMTRSGQRAIEVQKRVDVPEFGRRQIEVKKRADAPGKTVPGKVVTGKVVPSEVIPGKVVPSKVVPSKVIPGTVVPGRTFKVVNI